MFCEPVKTSYAPAENIYKTPDKCYYYTQPPPPPPAPYLHVPNQPFSVNMHMYLLIIIIIIIIIIARSDASRNVAITSNASTSSDFRKIEGKCIPFVICYHYQNHLSSF